MCACMHTILIAAFCMHEALAALEKNGFNVFGAASVLQDEKARDFLLL